MASGFAPDPRRKRLRTQALSASGIAVSGDGSVPQRLAILRAAAVVLHTPHMAGGIQGLLLPEQQRRTLDELTVDLDLRAGDARSKQSAFWTMLVLSAVIASAGILTDSTATVIGAMIIAPLSTPIMGIALAIAKRERNGSLRFVAAGVVVVVCVGVLFSLLLPADYNLLSNSQISSRTSPGLLDMIAAMATGLAGAVALARKDVAAVLPGVAIAISLVPPLAVVGVCLGKGDVLLALGAGVLFISNLLAMVLAGSLVYAVLGYAEEAIERDERSSRRRYMILAVLFAIVLIPLFANTAATYLLFHYTNAVAAAAKTWVSDDPGATVTGVANHGLSMTIEVQTADQLPPTSALLSDLQGTVPDFVGITITSTQGQVVELRAAGFPSRTR
jgi:uncharacterized hydrophobic protein (TIGR00271 family)